MKIVRKQLDAEDWIEKERLDTSGATTPKWEDDNEDSPEKGAQGDNTIDIKINLEVDSSD